MKYDAVILSHPKDYNKLPFCLNSLQYLDPHPENIYVISPDRHTAHDNVCSVLDNEAIDVSVQDIQYKRPFWILQQLFGLYQNFTKNDIYMIIDGDVIFNRKIQFAGKTFFISDREQHHIPYFNFMSEYFNIQKNVDYTFINDFMVFDKNICRSFLPPLKTFVQDLNTWLQDEKYLLAEYELYGNYVHNSLPGEYTTKFTKQKTMGQFAMWDTPKLEILVELMKNVPVDLFTVHTWT
jgi:hypothetical protein